MRFVTTLLLIAATALGGGYWYWQAQRAADAPATDATSADLAHVTPADLVRIDVADVTLEKSPTGVWQLPGGWPTRAVAVDALLDALTGLRSRFAPLPLTKPEEFGLAPDQKPLTVKVALKMPSGGEKTLTLAFGEKPADHDNPFIRPTFVRIDDRNEVLRLAPGLLSQLRVSRTDFLRKQLFPDVVRAKLADPAAGGDLPPAPVPLLDAAALTVTSPDGNFELKRTVTPEPRTGPAPVAMSPDKLAAGWELTGTFTDRVDPDKLRGVLAAVPELWVEQFLPNADPATTGLDNPERTVLVKSGNNELKLLIGKVSRVNEIKPPPPPPPNPLAPPPPVPQPIREEFRYAKLPGNPQIFEIKADRFADLFVKPADLRDPRLARFKAADVKSVAIVAKDLKLKFAKEKDAGGDERWKMIEPSAAPAEGPKIIEMLDKLDNLQARGPDVSDPADRKPFGLADDDAATTVTLGFGDDTKPLVYRLGKDDPAKARLYVQVAGRPRVNAVPDDLRKMVERPALAYRSRRVLDMPARTLTRITVDRPADPYALSQTDGIWSLAVPVATKADTGKANSLAADLARLEAADFVNFNPTPEDLKNYGLDAPTLKVTVAGEGSKTVLFGKPREGKPEIYAKLADAGEVFALRSGVKDAVDQPSLAYRPLQLWAAPGAIVSRIGVDRDAKKYELTRDGAIWKIAGPFSANAFLPAVQPLVEAASAPRAEKFVAHTDADLATYGLDKPAGTLTVTLTPERPEDPSGTRTLIFGKNVTEGQAPRYARLDGQPGVFVLPAGDVVDKTALDLLDRRLLQIDTRQIIRLGGVGPTGTWSAKRDGANWTLDSFNPPVPGDRATLERLAGVLADIRASQFAAYGPGELAAYGLDKPTNTFEITLGTGDKPTKHVITLGLPVPGSPQARFARVDDGPAIAQLNPLLSMELGVSPLELADRVLFNFMGRDLAALVRTIGTDELRIERKDGAWQITKPAAVPADEPAMAELAERVGSLRAVKVAALGVKDFKQYGLEPPAASFRFTVTEPGTAPRELTLALGNPTPQGRPARVGTSDTVYLIPDSAGDPLAGRLTAPPIKFRDRTLARFNDADRVTIKRGERTVTFAKVDSVWKVTAPIAADAEVFDLEDLVLLASKLRCDDLLADTKGDLKPFGLEKPEATLTFFLGDKEIEKFAVSAKDAEGRVNVRVGESPMVGKLDLALSTRLLNEFRKRAMWTNLDVAQVETLILNAGAGGTPAVFNKSDAGWQLAGEPDRTVNIEAITDLLATFAALKAERYVADQKPELKLYGLEPPVRVIIVKTRTGNPTTLHIGRFEGDSKRAYATVPGAGTVVVLSEADSAKLLRPAGELSRK